jgi:hypothetical protein
MPNDSAKMVAQSKESCLRKIYIPRAADSAVTSPGLKTPALATMDLRILKYFPFGGAKRLDVVAEFFNLFNRANVSQINPVFGVRFDSDTRIQATHHRNRCAPSPVLFRFRVLTIRLGR